MATPQRLSSIQAAWMASRIFSLDLAGIVGEIRQRLHPLPEIGEAQIDDVGLRVMLLELDGDVVDVGPAHP